MNSLERQPPLRLWEYMVVGIVLGIGFGLRTYKASVASISYDEAYSYLKFALLPVQGIFTDYHYPNNHILNTLLMKFSASIFGPQEIYLRFHSVLSYLVMASASLWLARNFLSRFGFLFVLLMVSFEPVLFDFSTQARGYVLGLSLFCVGLCIYVRHGKEFNPISLLGASACFILAIGAVPVHLNPVGALFIGIVVADGLRILWKEQTTGDFVRSQLTYTLFLYGPTMLGSFLWYVGVEADPTKWPSGHDHWQKSVHELFVTRYQMPLSVTAEIWLAALVGTLGALGPLIAIKRKNALAFSLQMIFLGSLILIALQHFVLGYGMPNPRMMIYLIFFAGWNVWSLIETQRPWSQGRRFLAIALMTAFVLPSALQIDLKSTYPWHHLVEIKPGMEAIYREGTKTKPKICYQWFYDFPFYYYRDAYGFEYEATCQAMTYRFDHKAGGMVKLR